PALPSHRRCGGGRRPFVRRTAMFECDDQFTGACGSVAALGRNAGVVHDIDEVVVPLGAASIPTNGPAVAAISGPHPGWPSITADEELRPVSAIWKREGERFVGDGAARTTEDDRDLRGLKRP